MNKTLLMYNITTQVEIMKYQKLLPQISRYLMF